METPSDKILSDKYAGLRLGSQYRPEVRVTSIRSRTNLLPNPNGLPDPNRKTKDYEQNGNNTYKPSTFPYS